MGGVARFRSRGWGRRRGALALCLTLVAACQDSDRESVAADPARAAGGSQVLRLSVETAPGVVEFDKKRLPSGLAYSMTSSTLPLGIAIRETTKATAITAAMT